MTADRVVKPFDAVEHIGSCLVSGSVDLVGGAFDFERGEKALHRRIVPNIAGPAHAQTMPWSVIGRSNCSLVY
jgi:hypothetical protein